MHDSFKKTELDIYIYIYIYILIILIASIYRVIHHKNITSSIPNIYFFSLN